MITSRGKLDLDNDAILKRCVELSKIMKDELNSYDDPSYSQTENQIKINKLGISPHNWEEFKEFVEMIESKYNKKITISWVNRFKASDSFPAHTHINSKNYGAKYSTFVYYVSVSENDESLEMIDDGVNWTPISVSTGDWVEIELDEIHRVVANGNRKNRRVSIVFEI